MYSTATCKQENHSDFLVVQSNRPADSLNEGLDLSSQSNDFLIERVLVLERQLKIRNSDCSRLLKERYDLQNAMQDFLEPSHEMIEPQKKNVSSNFLQAKPIDSSHSASQPRRYTPAVPASSDEASSAHKIDSRTTLYTFPSGRYQVWREDDYGEAMLRERLKRI